MTSPSVAWATVRLIASSNDDAYWTSLRPIALTRSFRINPGDGVFAGGINVQHLDCVGVVESGGELGHQVARTGVAMRLKDHVDPVIARLPCGVQRGANFRRVVAVVVDHIHPASTPFQLKPSIHSAKVAQRLRNVFAGQPQAGCQSPPRRLHSARCAGRVR